MGTPDGQQARGLLIERGEIESLARCSVILTEAREPEAIRQAVKHSKPDVVVLLPDWRWTSEVAEALCQDLSSTGTRVVFVDYYAPANSPHFGVLPYVSTYIKRQVLRDRSLYQQSLIGGTPFTDYIHNHLGFDCSNWGFRSKLDPAFLDKVVVGWNLGVCERYRSLCRLTGPLSVSWRLRPYELNARIGLATRSATGEWYEKYRAYCCEVVSRLERRPRMPEFGRVGSRRYYAELLMSRTVLSPFGWGEVCFRDYEAVACGCLLLKPSMDHLETEPNIYRAGETYVPLRWDLTDLEEKIEWISNHPSECRDIVRRGQKVLLNYFDEHRLARLVSSILLNTSVA